jgi:hypothetical protein
MDVLDINLDNVVWFKHNEMTGIWWSIDNRPETLEQAWRKSLEKWYLLMNGEYVPQVLVGCGLCNLYYKLAPGSCEGCPVYEDTEERNCFGTPYVDWEEGSNEDGITDKRELAALEYGYLCNLYKATHNTKDPFNDNDQRTTTRNS